MKKRKKQTIPDELRHNIPYIAVFLSIFLSHFIYPHDSLKVFLTFILLIPIFAFLKLDSRIPIGYAILMLVLAAVTLAFRNDENLANQLAIYAYWLLVVGTTLMLIEYAREGKKKKGKRR